MRFILRLCEFAAIALSTLTFSSCSIERLFPEKVANGVARLTVNNLGNLLLAVYDESTYNLPATDLRQECNLRSLQKNANTLISRETNGHGKVTWQFSDCIFDFGASGFTIETPSLCGEKKTTFFGKARISGTRSITGILTGNIKTPVIPSATSGVDFHFSEIVFQNYKVKSDGLDKAMTIVSGSAAFDANVHLAKNKVTTLCDVALPNLTLTNIRYSPIVGASETIIRLPGVLGEFQAIIDGSELKAQVGIFKETANSLSGILSLWGKDIAVPTDGSAIDPGFSTEAYEESLKCNPELHIPVIENCPYEPDIAGAAARLTVKNLANLMAAITSERLDHERPECNLGKLSEEPTKISKLSRNESEITWDFQDCVYDFTESGTQVLIGSPADNKSTEFFGKVTLSGTRKISGLYIGDRVNPVIPGRGGVEFEIIKANFDNFQVKSPNSVKSMKIATGSVGFHVNVHFAKSKDMNLCTIQLPNLTLRNVKYLAKTDLVLPADFGDLDLVVDDSNFGAQVYRYHDKENHIEGALNIFGNWVSLGARDDKLDPEYDKNVYDDILASKLDLDLPVNHDCDSFDPVEAKLADAAARLSVSNLANLVMAANKLSSPLTQCRLGSFEGGKIDENSRNNQGEGAVTWLFKDCVFDFGTAGKDIEGTQVFGKVILSGKKTVFGLLTGDANFPVIPSQEGIDFHIENAIFENYRVKALGIEQELTITSGRAAFQIQVHLPDGDINLASKPDRNPTLKNIRYLEPSHLVVFIPSGPFSGTFKITVEESDFHAQVDQFRSRKNLLEGSIKLYGVTSKLPTDGLGLNDKMPFSTGNDALLMPIKDPYEDIKSKVAHGISRLSINNLGKMLQEVTDPNRRHQRKECELRSLNRSLSREPFAPSRRNDKVVWDFEDCVFDFKSSENPALSGRVTLSGQREITGFLTQDGKVIPGEAGIIFRFSKVRFENFWAESGLNKTLAIDSGSASFDVKVHLGKSASTNLCIVPLPNLTFSSIRVLNDPIWGHPKVRLLGDIEGLTQFSATIQGYELEAQVGYGKDKPANSIQGEISLFGNSYSIPTDGDGLLPGDFNAAYRLLLDATSDLASLDPAQMYNCDSFERVEALSIARLLVLNVATITQESYYEYLKPKESWYQLSKCGFNSNYALYWSQVPGYGVISGKPGQKGSVQVDIKDCDAVNQSADGLYTNDCEFEKTGTRTVINGKATVSGRQLITGVREPYDRLSSAIGRHVASRFELLSSIRPDHPEAMSFDLSEINPDYFTAYNADDAHEKPEAMLILKSGPFSAQVAPVLTARKGDPCRFERSTPIVKFVINIKNTVNSQLIINKEHFHYIGDTAINSASLKAQNGVYQGKGNYLSGEIEVNHIKHTFENENLRPDYDQTKFDASYECRKQAKDDEYSIESIVPHWEGWKPDCSMIPNG